MSIPRIDTAKSDAAAIRAALDAETGLRPRDLAIRLGVSEADLLAARVGRGVTRIAAAPDLLMAEVCGLGEVMALTRNDSAVHERTGVYEDWHPGDHAAMVLGPEIDLRIFPAHWVHGFALRNDGGKGPPRSLQVFDAAGQAVHKVYPREGTDLDAWDAAVARLATGDVSDTLTLEPAPPPETACSRPDRAAELREAWASMTDTHQFLRLVSRLKMNRLGAYRIAGEPLAVALAPSALNAALIACAAEGIGIMLFVGNRGCIQIHSGPIATLKEMGPWQNVLDPRFNLHLRLDRVAEVWLVDKPTRRGAALSIEAFDAEGALILQLFGKRASEGDRLEAFSAMAAGLARLGDGIGPNA
ncbi:hemin-degrading factor [Roseicyclus sp.]|uniref:hemin-degrading factor n=1 Tax=Roseicyclus sp. TaxID=1914329 RepID=UPI003FA070F5